MDIIIGNRKTVFQSPFKEYYFSDEKLENNKAEYTSLLSSLKCFVQAVRDYRKQENIKTKDVVDFLEITEKNKIPVVNKNPLTMSEEGAVSLITAHGAKGKEYEVVFILNCHQGEWARSKNSKKIKLFSNTPFGKAGDKRDDWIRLFYVTLTRAKSTIYLTFHKQKNNKRENIPLEFLSELDIEKSEEKVDLKNFSSVSGVDQYPAFLKKEEEVLSLLTKDYKLSPTGFSSYLDIVNQGPDVFLKKNILRFPEKKSLSLSYGTAIHEALSNIQARFKERGSFLSEKEVCDIFKALLKKERLSDRDFKKLLKKGRRDLVIFYREKKELLKKEDETEKDFKNQNCEVKDVPITGKIDKISFSGGDAEVTDFKTGKPLITWDKGSNSEKIKLWNYRNQLVFYKILIENSTEYKEKYKVNRGVIDFITPGEDERVVSLDLDITEEETERTKALICAVGRRIKNLNFNPEPKGDKIDDIRSFEERILKD